ncbi:MAG: PEGA domain-containing protein [bacterium]
MTRFIRQWILLSPALFLLWAASASSPAQARKPWEDKGRSGWSYRVYLTSAPEQAAVYVNDKSHGIMCYTPCNKIRLPRKKNLTLIFAKDGYKDLKHQFYGTSRWRRYRINVVLVREIQPGIIDVQSDVSGNAAGAMIYVDGVQKGTVPMKIKVAPGRHQVIVRKPGFKSHSKWVTVAEKQVWTVSAMLKPLAKPKGTLLISADVNGAEVYVDGKLIGTAPVVVPDLAVGPHTVEIKAKGATPWKQVVVVESGKTATVKAAIGASIPKSGTLRVVCNVPGADVYVDGDRKGVCPATVHNLIPGDHIVLVKTKGYEPKQVPFKVVINQQSLVTVDLEKQKVDVPSATIRIQSDQPDAQIILDGRRMGKAPIELKEVGIGLHIVKVMKRGFMTHTEKFTLKKGDAYTITALLKAGGMIKITSSPPGATIFIDTKPVGRTPLLDYTLQVGTYAIDVELNGFHREKRSIAIEGGKPASIHLDLREIRTGPTNEEVIRGLSSFGAMTVVPGKFTADITLGFLPYFAVVRLTVGAYKKGNFGIDAGVIVRVQGMINSFAAHVRSQFLAAGPFSLGAFLEIGGGPGWKSRNTVEFSVGAVASLSFRNLITVSVRMWGKVYSDAYCLSERPNINVDYERESEAAWCQELDIVDPADTTARDAELARVPPAWRGHLRESADAHRGRLTGGRFMMSLDVEIAVAKWASIHLELRGAPGSKQRSMWQNYFNVAMFGEQYGDPRVYGGGGITFKF